MATSSFITLLESRPQLHARYGAFLDAVNNSADVPDRIYDLCRARIEQIHGRQTVSDPDQADGFSDAELAALTIADKIPFQHHQLEDDEVEQLRVLLGDAACVSLLTSLAFVDVSCRLNQSLEAINVNQA